MRILLSVVLLLFVAGFALGREFDVENKTPYRIKATLSYTYNDSLGQHEAHDSLMIERNKKKSMNFSHDSADGEVDVTVKAPDNPEITSCFLSEYRDMHANLHIKINKSKDAATGTNQLECIFVDNKN